MIAEINQYIKMWEARCYSDGIPDEAPKEIDDMVPSYKRIVLAIMKNDISLLGFSRPASEYYGMLKAIELNKPYKPKHMTQQELKQEVFQLVTTMLNKKCYIKGYGDKFRVCDATHSPVKNISKATMAVLEFNSTVIRSGLIWVLNITKHPFAHAVDVKLPSKETE